MNRLTYSDGLPCDVNLIDCIKKLQKLEDIEEEVGCPLEVIFKALKNKQVIFKHIVGLENPKITLESHKIIEISFDGENYGLWLYGYGYGDELYVYTDELNMTIDMFKITTWQSEGKENDR